MSIDKLKGIKGGASSHHRNILYQDKILSIGGPTITHVRGGETKFSMSRHSIDSTKNTLDTKGMPISYFHAAVYNQKMKVKSHQMSPLNSNAAT